ncbi:MAG: hypothetical protein ACOX8G_09720 [Eubacterium sp.]|jgi:hypothetical protein|uniref:hypothetical protein n=1 Tax=Clostridium sp. (strain SY8519) TaxID=1042156 RepID=UPI00021721A6|nr:hypothetical protein [Clostridium sp. SY8519]BAK46284.1 hypothetical protein CXIVA_03170 [Clostridium sp. SY8519]
MEQNKRKPGKRAAITILCGTAVAAAVLTGCGAVPSSSGTAGSVSGSSSVPEKPGGGGGQQTSAPSSYDAVREISADTAEKGKTYQSTGTDENALLVNGADAEARISDAVIARTSETSKGGDSSSFYGVGAAALVTKGSLFLNNSTITTDAKGGAGVFAYGSGTVYVSGTKITTSQDTSGGLHAAGGGTLYAWDCTVSTSGESSAAIRSDRGGGTMVVDGGTYTSAGTGSPAVYSTADITVNQAELTAKKSEAVCIEGANTLRLYNCDLTGNMSDDAQNDTTWNVILYQSMSGDSEEGNSTFRMTGGSLTAKNGGMFYTTNTESTFYLKNVDLTYADDAEFFLRCTGNSNQRGWGTSGKNGADCTFTADQQDMEGTVIYDSISTLKFYMKNGSTLKGSFADDESDAGDGGDGTCSVVISKDSTWVVTGNSTVTSLNCAGTIRDTDGNTVTIKGTDGTVYVKGNSKYTITVTSYSTKTDFSGASSGSSYSKYAKENPLD